MLSVGKKVVARDKKMQTVPDNLVGVAELTRSGAGIPMIVAARPVAGIG